MKTKTCCHCHQEKPLTEFNKRKASKDGYQPRCKECHGIHNKRHYKQNKTLYLQRAQKHRKAVRENFRDWYRQFKGDMVCSKCGEDKPWRLAFHHVDPSQKDMNISELMNRGSKKRLIEEAAKCIVVCHNCHSDIHHKERINGSSTGWY